MTAAIFACNRSGSTVLFELLRRLRAAPSLTDNRFDRGDRAQCRAQYNAAIERLESGFGRPLDFTAVGASRLGTVDFVGAVDRRFVFVSGLPVPRHPFDEIHVTYCDPDVERLALVDDRDLFVPIRNPLDILVSHAFEVEHVVLETDGPMSAATRERFGRARLGDRTWVTGAANYIAGFYQAVANCPEGTFHACRYEALLVSPVPVIVGLGRACGVELSERAAADHWAAVGMRPLKRNPAHFFRPGAEKWRQYLDARHLSWLRNAGFPALLAELGYEFPDRLPKRATDDSFTHPGLAIGDAMNHLMFATPITFGDAALRFGAASGNARVVADDPQLFATALSVVGDTVQRTSEGVRDATGV